MIQGNIQAPRVLFQFFFHNWSWLCRKNRWVGLVGKLKTLNPAFPMSTPSLFKWRHFLPEIILLNVRWYCRYPLSYRDLEEMMRSSGC